jgi:antitoxin MazE
MRAKIQKWGNSLGIRLPKSVTVEAHLVEGSEVDITAAGGQIVITQAFPMTYVLSDLLASYPDRKAPKEEEWGAPVGSEEW